MNIPGDTHNTGITAFGAYIPAGRLPLALIDGAAAFDPNKPGPEKAVAGFDEDAITLAVAACNDCLLTVERGQVDALFFISTSSPFQEKQGAAVIAKALDLRGDVLTADFGGSLRGAGAAVCAAIDAVRADPRKNVLVVASDCRTAPEQSALERNLGDAAVAFLVGADAAVVCEHSAAVNEDMFDIWQGRGDASLHSWEDRFNIAEGYNRCTAQAVRDLFANSGTSAADYAAVACYGPDARSHRALLTGLGFGKTQIVDALFGRVGNCGAAFAPLLLAHRLETVKPGERILLALYGDGAQALALRAVAPFRASAQRGVSGYLAQRKIVADYNTYRVARQLDSDAEARRGGDGVPATVFFRDRDATIGFRGARCTHCGTLHFPPTRVCYRCYRKDEFEPARLSDRRGTLLSFTLDYFFPSPELPLAAGVCDIDGARVYLQLTGVNADQLRCGLPLQFVFRKIHGAGGRPNYYWKGTPVVAGTSPVEEGTRG